MSRTLAATPLLLGLFATSAQAASPDFTGPWKMNHALSADAKAKVAEVAGPDAVAGSGRTLGATAFLPRNYGSEVDRVNIREFLEQAVASLEELEIEQSATEIKVIHGDENVRIFNLTRPNSGSGAAGVTVSRTTRWQGDQLVLESQSGEAKLTELLTLVPSRNQLIHAIRYEAKVLKKPLELTLVYDKATKPSH